jgi:hypothetical protein
MFNENNCLGISSYYKTCLLDGLSPVEILLKLIMKMEYSLAMIVVIFYIYVIFPMIYQKKNIQAVQGCSLKDKTPGSGSFQTREDRR